MGRVVLAIQGAGYAEDAVAVGASGIATESNGEKFERGFLTVEVEAIDPPEHLYLPGDVNRIVVGTGIRRL